MCWRRNDSGDHVAVIHDVTNMTDMEDLRGPKALNLTWLWNFGVIAKGNGDPDLTEKICARLFVHQWPTAAPDGIVLDAPAQPFVDWTIDSVSALILFYNDQWFRKFPLLITRLDMADDFLAAVRSVMGEPDVVPLATRIHCL